MGVCVLRRAIYLEGQTIMILSVDAVSLVLSLACFLGAAVQVSSPRVNLTAAGLALWVSSVLF